MMRALLVALVLLTGCADIPTRAGFLEVGGSGSVHRGSLVDGSVRRGSVGPLPACTPIPTPCVDGDTYVLIDFANIDGLCNASLASSTCPNTFTNLSTDGTSFGDMTINGSNPCTMVNRDSGQVSVATRAYAEWDGVNDSPYETAGGGATDASTTVVWIGGWPDVSTQWDAYSGDSGSFEQFLFLNTSSSVRAGANSAVTLIGASLSTTLKTVMQFKGTNTADMSAIVGSTEVTTANFRDRHSGGVYRLAGNDSPADGEGKGRVYGFAVCGSPDDYDDSKSWASTHYGVASPVAW